MYLPPALAALGLLLIFVFVAVVIRSVTKGDRDGP
jgi:hypothetical protein